MKMIDRHSGCVIAEITTNRSMSIDEALMLMQYTVNEDGMIMAGETLLNAGFEDLYLVY